MPLENFFKGSALIAFTSDASIDFTPQDFNSPLTEGQRAYLKKNCGIDIPQVFWRKQIHGDDILEADKSYVIPAQAGIQNQPVHNSCPEADAYITNEKNLPIAIRTADCVPIFIFDPVKRVIGLAHAGWKGTYRQIAVKTIQKMQEKYACRILDLKVFLGPAIRQCCYQVGEEFRQYFPDHVKERDGKLYADLIGANRDQLLKIGDSALFIGDSGKCTCCNQNYHSFRRDREKSGRMISLMILN